MAAAGPSRRRLFGLALLAGGLSVSFYALLLALALAVLWGIAFLLLGGRGWAVALALPAGLLVGATRRSLVAAIPRGPRGELPGVEVARGDLPEVWAQVDELAGAAGQSPPERLRVMFAGSAAATERAPAGGGAPQRILLIPFCYLVALSRAELSAVIAHELGHFAAGDTTVSRWIFWVSGAIRRTVAQLERYRSILRFPFQWYAHGFFALTAASSRRRELAADALAASLCGPEVVAAALRRSELLDAAFDRYWAGEARPLLNSGMRPPLAAGFRSFLNAPDIGESLPRPANGASERFASHPPIARRLVLLESMEAQRREEMNSSTADWQLDLESLEASLLVDLAGERGRAPTPQDPQAQVAEGRHGGPVELTLDERAVDGILARVVFWLILAFGLPITAVLLLVPLPATTSVRAQVVIRGVGLVMGFLLAWLIWARRQARTHPGLLSIDAGGLTLAYARLLREPLRIGREAIRVLTVDQGEGAPTANTRFPVYAGEAFAHHDTRTHAPLGWLWPAARAQLPLYSLQNDTPNTLILLARPIAGPRVRRETLHGPLNGELLRGLAVRVKDPEQAARSLQAAGLMGKLTEDDVRATLAPDTEADPAAPAKPSPAAGSGAAKTRS